MLAPVALALALVTAPSGAPSAADARGPGRAPRIVFLPEDFPGGHDHRGGSAALLVHLERYVARHAPASHVRFDLRRVLRAGVEPFYVYAKRHCRPIGDVLGANVFVMARLTVVEPSSFPAEERYDVEAKAYASETDREVRLLRARRVRAKDLRTLIEGKEEELLARILSAAEPVADATRERR